MRSYFIYQRELINKQLQVSQVKSSYSENLCIVKTILHIKESYVSRSKQNNESFYNYYFKNKYKDLYYCIKLQCNTINVNKLEM